MNNKDMGDQKGPRGAHYLSLLSLLLFMQFTKVQQEVRLLLEFYTIFNHTSFVSDRLSEHRYASYTIEMCNTYLYACIIRALHNHYGIAMYSAGDSKVMELRSL